MLLKKCSELKFKDTISTYYSIYDLYSHYYYDNTKYKFRTCQIYLIQSGKYHPVDYAFFIKNYLKEILDSKTETKLIKLIFGSSGTIVIELTKRNFEKVINISLNDNGWILKRLESL